MAIRSRQVRDGARVALASIRLVNGCAALAVPGTFARRLGADPALPGTTYGLRLFGVRTVLIGWELLQHNRNARARAVRLAPVVHAGDTVAALLAGASGALPPRAARTAVLVSATNLALALAAQPPRD
jgi:hypothetical protein